MSRVCRCRSAAGRQKAKHGWLGLASHCPLPKLLRSNAPLSLLAAGCCCLQLVFSSSACVYGEPERVPIDETAALGALNPYGRTKVRGLVGALPPHACPHITLPARSTAAGLTQLPTMG
jgi:hypothetical protein